MIGTPTSAVTAAEAYVPPRATGARVKRVVV